MDMTYAERADELLAAHGLRRTPGRIALLQLFARQDAPVPAEFLEEQLAGKLDRGNLYRALQAFTTERILTQYDFGGGRTHFELTAAKQHHHHAVCNGCGKVEDVPAHDTPDMSRKALAKASGFASFSGHSLQFFGTCVSCAP